MADERILRGYRSAWRVLLRLYPRAHHDRFRDEMIRDFDELLAERIARGGPLLPLVLRLFAEAAVAALRERALRHRRQLGVAGIVGGILLVPFLAMRTSDEVSWTGADFLVAGALLLATGLALEAVLRTGGGVAYRAGACMTVSTTFLLVWTSLAVGIAGDGEDPVELLHLGVVGVGLAGAVRSRLRASGMATTLLAMALAQAAVLVLVVSLPWASHALAEPSAMLRTAVLEGAFIGAFLAAGALFRSAVQTAS